MLTKNTIVKIISGVLIGGVVLSIGGMAFAKNTTTDTTGNVKNRVLGKAGMAKHQRMGMTQDMGKMIMWNMQEGIETVLEDLVASGVITRTKADELKSYIRKKEEEQKAEIEKFKNMTPEERKTQFEENKGRIMPRRVDILEDAVTEGMLTKDEAGAIKDKIAEINEEMRQKRLSDALNALVQKGTISQEQMDKILQYIENKEKQMKEMMDSIKAMTPEERRQYMQSNMGDKRIYTK